MGEHVFVYRRYTPEDFHAVRLHQRHGHSDYEVARLTGFPRSTIQAWRHRNAPPGSRTLKTWAGWRPPHRPAYSYLLGLYLGDGCLVEPARGSSRLVLSLDLAYPAILSEATAGLLATLPGAPVRCNPKGASRSIVLSATHPAWPFAFPQHGPGRKHERAISLEDWQQRITHRHPDELIRGLIHSDGARCINRFKTRLPGGRIAEYSYPRYFFSNLSEDIRRIFCEHCDLLGIRWTQSNWRNISISHRDSVALLDTFVGPKR
jgi:hypothetical protein